MTGRLASQQAGCLAPPLCLFECLGPGCLALWLPGFLAAWLHTNMAARLHANLAAWLHAAWAKKLSSTAEDCLLHVISPKILVRST